MRKAVVGWGETAALAVAGEENPSGFIGHLSWRMLDTGCCLCLRRAADEWATQKGTLRLNRLSTALGRTAAAARAERTNHLHTGAVCAYARSGTPLNKNSSGTAAKTVGVCVFMGLFHSKCNPEGHF